MTPYKVDIQSPYPEPLPFKPTHLKTWAQIAMQTLPSAELTIRLVNNEDIQALNCRYRHKNTPTNVLAFPSTIPPYVKQKRPFLGDVILAPDVLYQEHLQHHRALDAHWAHIIIHGVLHLLGYTHETPVPAKTMQALEKQYLAQLHYPNPYETENLTLE